MALELRKVQKSKSKLRIGLAGTSGSGKTYSALLLAKGLVGDWNKVAVIDTENGSADLYEHLGGYHVITLQSPFIPIRVLSYTTRPYISRCLWSFDGPDYSGGCALVR